MSHRDGDGCRSSGSCVQASVPGSGGYAQELAAAVDWLLADVDWAGIGLRRDCGWSARGLVTAALLWAWSTDATLRERFDLALRVARRLCGKAVPKSVSYQAFIKLLVRWTPQLVVRLAAALRLRMEREFPDRFRTAGFVVLAGDGSKIGLARTKSNESRFSPAKTRQAQQKRKGKRGGRRSKSRKAQRRRSREKKADSPQLALTVLFHVGLRLLWDWRIGPSDSSERDHLREMVPGLPHDALITADCGFVGYDFWKTLLDSGRHFVIRVGGNVRLLKQLGVVRESLGTIYLWPDKVAKKNQPPLVLRLVVVQGGRHPWFLVTSVRDSNRLSDRQVADIYRQRWGIELFFRHFKQTYGRTKLRSHKAEHAECELHWSLLGLWTMLLYAQARLPRTTTTTTTTAPSGMRTPRLSASRVIKAFGRALHEYRSSPLPNQSLTHLLETALIDPYKRRDKRSRDYPRKKYEPPAKAPKITRATQNPRQQAQQLATTKHQKGLPA